MFSNNDVERLNLKLKKNFVENKYNLKVKMYFSMILLLNKNTERLLFGQLTDRFFCFFFNEFIIQYDTKRNKNLIKFFFCCVPLT